MTSEQSGRRQRSLAGLRRLVGIILWPFYAVAFAIYLASLLIVFAPLYLGFYVIGGFFLYLFIWWRWCGRGRYVLFVYSDSPIWHDYLEEHILPRLGERAIMLNWSRRSQWKRTSLPVLAFRYFGGSRKYNPMAVVFRPFRRARRFRFYEPFREFKHGKPEAVARMERDLFDLVGKTARVEL